MNDWNTSSLKGIGEVISGGTPSTLVNAYWHGSIIWITPADLSKITQPFITTSSKKITKEGLANSSANLIPAYNIVMSSRAPIGYFALPTIDFCTNQGCKSIRVNENNDSLFHYYNLTFNVRNILKYGEGTTFAEISKKQLEKVEFSYPLLTQQKKIAKILYTCDTVINQTEQAIKKYQAIKQGMMIDFFTRGIDVNTGKLRPSYEEQPGLYKQSELGWIPKDWELSQFEDVVIPIDGDRGHAYPNQSQLHSEGYCLFLSAKNVTKNGFAFNKNIFISQERDNLMGNGKLDRGDIIITTRGTVGNTAIYDESVIYDHIRINSGMLILRNKVNGKLINKFIETFLLSHIFRKQLDRILSGSAQPQITVKNVNSFNILFPIDISEQEAIVNKITAIDTKLAIERSTLEKYKQIKAGLMQDLLTGKVQVQTDDVANINRK